MKTFAKLLATAAVAMVAAPASAAPLLYSYFENGSDTARFTFVLDDKPFAGALPSNETRQGFGTGAPLTLFWADQPMSWGIQFYTLATGGGFSALGASGDSMVGAQLFTGSVTNPTMLTGRFNLVNQFSPFQTAVLTVAAIPEPATWAMMLVGFGMVGGAARYRRRVTKVTFG